MASEKSKANLKPFSKENQPQGRGRPKGSHSRSTILRKWLEVTREIPAKGNPSGKAFKGTVEDELMLALIAKGTKGDVFAIREILDTVYGKQSNVNLNLTPEELQNLTDEELDSLITKIG